MISTALSSLLDYLSSGPKTVAEAHRHLMALRLLAFGVEVEDIIREGEQFIVWDAIGDTISRTHKRDCIDV